MKFIILFMVIAALHASAKVYSQYAKVTFSIKNGTVEDVFKEIEKQSHFNIFYKVDQIDVNEKVSLIANNQLISDVLDKVLSPGKLTYTVLDKIIVIRGNEGRQDGGTISGTVIDESTNEPIPGANVIIRGTTTGTVTDANGNFTLQGDKETVTLKISFVGFIPKEMEVTALSQVQVSLAPDIMGLEEIVVIGYGVEKKSLLTGAISSVKASDIANTSISRAEQALQGRTAGVYVLPNSGSPGSGIKVRIRGAGSNGNANPLYIVDGVKATDINNLNPNDIESMEVLKDAASSAIYGAEGANGVVIITTKTGKAGVSKVEYSYQYGMQSAGNLPSMMNASQYIDFMNDGLIPAVTSSGYDTDWLGEIFEKAPVQSHNILITGGNEMTSLVTSLSYLNQDGIVGGSQSNFKRITGRLNADHTVNKWLKVGTRIGYSNFKRASFREDTEFDGVLAGALAIDPMTPVFYNDTTSMPGTIRALYRDGTAFNKNKEGQYYAISQYIQGEAVNPVLRLDLAKGNTTNDNVLGNFYVDISPIQGLTYTSRAGIDYTHQSLKSWNPRYYYSDTRSNGTASVVNNTFTESKWQWENFATFNTAIGQNNFNIVAGMSAEALEYRLLNATKERMFVEDDLYSELNYTAGDEMGRGNINGNLFRERILSYFGRVSYNYMSKYMLQASLRRDGASTSLLPPGENWGIFPSFSAGWVLSEETFFPKEAINFMKIRASWGQNGSLSNLRRAWTQYEQFSPFQDITQYAYLDAVVNEFILYNGIVGAEPGYLPNPDLTWETSQQTNIGLDLRFLGGRMSFTADYFVKETKDLLALIPAPAPAGNRAPFANVGDVKNSGFELNLGYMNMQGEFKYQANINLSTLKNEVTALNADAARLPGMRVGPSWMGATAFEVGEPVWYFRGFKTDGVVNGNPVIVDISGPNGTPDGQITDDDLTNIGSPHPKLIYGGNINLAYKGFDLGIFAQGVSGNKIIMAFVRSDRATCNKPEVFYDNMAFRNPDVDPNIYRSDMLVFDGSYTRIKQLQLGYILPSSVLNQLGLGKTRLYVSLEDYFTFTKYEGMDPEAGSTEDSSIGIDRGVYPVPRKIMFGLSVSF